MQLRKWKKQKKSLHLPPDDESPRQHLKHANTYIQHHPDNPPLLVMAGNWSLLVPSPLQDHLVPLPLQDSYNSDSEPESDSEHESEVTNMLDSSDE